MNADIGNLVEKHINCHVIIICSEMTPLDQLSNIFLLDLLK